MNIHLPRCSLLLLNIAWNFGTGWVNSFRRKEFYKTEKAIIMKSLTIQKYVTHNVTHPRPRPIRPSKCNHRHLQLPARPIPLLRGE